MGGGHDPLPPPPWLCHCLQKFGPVSMVDIMVANFDKEKFSRKLEKIIRYRQRYHKISLYYFFVGFILLINCYSIIKLKPE